MATTPWFRVWADMVNDPKFRTIARVSKQEISRVISVYMHMLTCASNAIERGRTEGWSDEDVATALDIEISDVVSIREAMQGRVLEGNYLQGWEKRQPLREDGAAERAKAWREKQKEEKKTQSNAIERGRTQEERRGEKRREELKTITPDGVIADSAADDTPGKPTCPHQEIIALYHEVLPQCPVVREWTPARATQLRARWNEEPRRQNLAYWREFFEYVGKCDFLVGKAHSNGKRPFFADLEWIVKSANFTKIREGKYAND